MANRGTKMKTIILKLFILFSFFSIANVAEAQLTGFTPTDTLRVQADTVLTATFSPTRALYMTVIAVNDTVVTDTIDVYNITEKFDTVKVALRNLRTYVDTEFIVLGSEEDREFLILSPNMNRVFLKARNTTARLHQRFYVRTARLQ